MTIPSSNATQQAAREEAILHYGDMLLMAGLLACLVAASPTQSTLMQAKGLFAAYRLGQRR